MAKQALDLGTVANDNTGDTLRAGGDKINDNFNELYTALGNGTTLTVNTTNPALLEDSPERKEANEYGWEIAYDTMEIKI